MKPYKKTKNDIRKRKVKEEAFLFCVDICSYLLNGEVDWAKG